MARIHFLTGNEGNLPKPSSPGPWDKGVHLPWTASLSLAEDLETVARSKLEQAKATCPT